jgi:putative ABC transport system substrate-binding protein
VEAKNIAIEDRSAEGKLDRLPVVADELVESLARPRGNVTGLTNLSPELSGKRLELLKEAVPGVTRVAFLWTPLAAAAIVSLKTTQETANALRLQLQPLELKDSKVLTVPSNGVKATPEIVTTPGPIVNSHQSRIFILPQGTVEGDACSSGVY